MSIPGGGGCVVGGGTNGGGGLLYVTTTPLGGIPMFNDTECCTEGCVFCIPIGRFEVGGMFTFTLDGDCWLKTFLLAVADPGEGGGSLDLINFALFPFFFFNGGGIYLPSVGLT